MRRFPLVFGAMRGKRVSAVLRTLAPLDPRPVFTWVEDPGAIEPRELLRRWQRASSQAGRSAANVEAALKMAADLRVNAEQPVVVAGSLYLVGAVRGMLRGEEDGE
jgi:folylpolyglutamate synthase/dihydropteroate synthase